MNTPNKLTILRVLLIPVFVIVYLNDSILYHNEIAAAIFIVASCTDFLDGYIARKYNLITNFGKFLDPLADKLLVNAALICFLVTPDNPVPCWVVIVIISRDFIISGFRLVASDNGVVIAADYSGKLKTVVQMVMTILVILDFDGSIASAAELVLIYLALALTVVSLFVCLIRNADVLRDRTVKESDVINELKKRNLTITFAESCTGGMLASMLIGIPDASMVIKQGMITYCDEAKINILGVKKDTINNFTAVSSRTAAEMAEGAQKCAGADIAVSVTGYADKVSDEPEKTGLVYIGIRYNDETCVEEFRFAGNRNSVRKQACEKAIEMIMRRLA